MLVAATATAAGVIFVVAVVASSISPVSAWWCGSGNLPSNPERCSSRWAKLKPGDDVFILTYVNRDEE